MNSNYQELKAVSLKSPKLNSKGIVKVLAPGTVANLVCGFDVLGMCLNEPNDLMEVKLLDEKKIIIHSADGYPLPTDPAQNTAGAPLIEMINELDIPVGFEVIIHKRIKPGSGIGSSAASAAGSVVAANHLLGNIFSNKDLVRFAMFGEKVASGVKHADNIAPCIYGGVTLIRSIAPLDIIPLSAPSMFVTVVHPQIEVKTADARQILPKKIQLKDEQRQAKLDEKNALENKSISTVSTQKRKLSFKEQTEYKQLEKDIEKLTKEKETLTQQLSGDVTNHNDIQKISEQIQTIMNTVDEKELRWLELSEFA